MVILGIADARATAVTRRRHPPLLDGSGDRGAARRAGRPALRVRGRRAAAFRERIGRVPPPFRIGVMQLTMEPLDEMIASARAMDDTGMDTIWLAEAYPWWRKHGMEARSSTVVSALIARRRAVDDRLGDHLRRSRATRCRSRWTRASSRRRRPEVHPRLRDLEDLPQQRADADGRTLGPMRDAVAIVRGVLAGGEFAYDGDTWSADVPALRRRRRSRRATCRPCTWPRPRRRCRRSPARSGTVA